MKRPILIAIASGLITAAAIKAAPALAQEASAGETRSAIVHTSDLNLQSEAGLRLLDRRLANAAREVCGDASVADLEGRNQRRLCISDTLARASAQRDSLLAASGSGASIHLTARR